MASKKATRPEDVDVVLLCGGLGKRLRSVVSDRPKPMADLGGRPFLDLLVNYTAGFGFRRCILCAGHMAGRIEEHFSGKRDLEVLMSVEDEPLGTGGAVKNARPLIKSEVFMVMNGDSFCRMDMAGFLDFHQEKKAFVSITLVTPEKEADYGAVMIDGTGRVMEFSEKTVSRGHINAGVYIFGSDIFGTMPEEKNFSLEYDLFPKVLDKGVYGYVSGGGLFDIGTPERYERARKELQGLL